MLPTYAELPVDEVISKRTAWGVFGEDDEIGTLNLLTDACVLAAAGEVRTGRRIGLNLPVAVPDPPITGGQARRQTPIRTAVELEGGAFLDDRLDEFWLQGSTQWDGLTHVRHRQRGFYNGHAEPDISSAPFRLGIQAWQPGVVGRGVLVDLPRWAADTGVDLSWNDSFAVTPDVLTSVLDHQGTDLVDGDILLLRSGWLATYLQQDYETREAIGTRPGLTSPGLHASEEMFEFLWDRRISAVAADNPSVEVTPPQGTGFGHFKLIPLLGFALGELWWLEDLSADCAGDGRYTCMLVSVPLNVPGGCGSPANAIAIK
jgi:kynurenine formamidase